jgi:hypothetical protein
MKKILATIAILIAVSSSTFGCQTADVIATLNASGGSALSSIILIGRHTTQCNWTMPDGRFVIHYDTAGQYAVYHPNEDIAPHDNIPDYVNRAADYLSLSYATYMQQLGFDPPPNDGFNGGDSLYDVYFTNVIGLTTPEEYSNQYPGRNAYTSFIQLGYDLRFPQRYGDDPLPFLKANVSHEFFHAVEFAYRAYSNDLTPWWFEACANWGEQKVFDGLNDVYYNLPSYLSLPYRSLYNTSGQFFYGAWLFPEYLDERFGPVIVRECWESFVDFNFAITAIDYALQAHNSNFNNEYCQHVVWNYFTGPNYHDGYYVDGASFGTTVFESKNYSIYPVNWTLNPNPLENVASSYIVFTNPGIDHGNLYLVYYNASSQIQKVNVAIIQQNGMTSFQTYDIQNGVPSTFMVPDFASDEKVVMMPIWVFEGSPKDGSTSYSYTAYVDTMATGIASPLVSSDKYVLNGAYPNPFNSAVLISFDSPKNQNYSFYIYDISGRRIFGNDGQTHSGTNIINWHAGPDVASGILYYVINLEGNKLVGRMAFVK